METQEFRIELPLDISDQEFWDVWTTVREEAPKDHIREVREASTQSAAVVIPVERDVEDAPDEAFQREELSNLVGSVFHRPFEITK